MQPANLTKPNAQKSSSASRYAATFSLLAISVVLGAIFYRIAHYRPLDHYVPEFVALMLLAGILYLVSVYIVHRYKSDKLDLFIILGATIVFRLLFLPLSPTLSQDVYRYEWEGRVERAHINPYSVFPAMPQLSWAENPEHPIETGKTTPTLYPPISELAFSAVHSIAGYKRLFTGLDLATVALLLALLTVTDQPLHRVLIYAWNPAVLVAFSLSGHNDSLAILTLIAAILIFIIGRRGVLSISFLAISFLSKLYPAFLLPLFLKRTRWAYAGIFAAVVFVAYLPFLRAGGHLIRGLSDFTAMWQGNDSLYRLILAAGNSPRQADMVAGALLLGLIIYVLKARMDILLSVLIILSGLLFLSSNAFPWYFTWIVPFLCFYTDPALLLMTVTCVLAYSPVITYVAGGSFANQSLMVVLEYLPVYVLLGYELVRGVFRRQTG